MSTLNKKAVPGSRPTTIVDIARYLGLSKTTVSSALTGNGRLNEETRALVLQTARELNYRAHPYAQSLRKRNSGEIVLVTENLDLGVATRKLGIIQQGLSQCGFNVPIYASNQDGLGARQENLMAEVARVQPRAVVCNAMRISPRAHDLLHEMQAQGTVVVCYDQEFPDHESGTTLDQIIFDREDNTYRAAMHLLELGHRQLGLVIFGNSPTAPLRRAGFERALHEMGGHCRPEWVYSEEIPASALFLEGVGVKAAQAFLQLRERPTGMCILNDVTAMAFTGEVMRHGVWVPQELSVIGHDDIPLCRYSVLRMSSVSHPVDEIAAAVIGRVQERLTNDSLTPAKQWIRGEVHGRDSTGPCQGAASGSGPFLQVRGVSPASGAPAVPLARGEMHV